MGFKRTNEGRVYFQSPDGTANDQPKNTVSTSKNKTKTDIDAPPPITGSSPAHTQIQIITLLKTLNERLKVTQAERDHFARELENTRELIENLQDKAEENEKAYRTLTQKIGAGGGSGVDTSHAEMLARDALAELEEARKIMLDLETKANRADVGVKALKQLQVDQAEKMAVSINHAAALTKRVKDAEEKQEQMGTRVDDALGQQARMARKLDKAIEERARFMRKIERIEETVLQTRDSLNAKAMVLLTDQGVAGQSGADIEHHPDLAQEKAAHTPLHAQDEDRKNQVLQAIGAGLLIVAALLGGWLINELQKPDVVTQTPVQNSTASWQAPSATSQQNVPTDMAAMDWSIDSDTSAFDAPDSQTAETNFQAPEANPANNDIGTLDLNDQEQIEALLSENPDAVAAALNEIEPANKLPENIIPSQASNQIDQDPAPTSTQEPAQAEPVRQTPKTQTPPKQTAEKPVEKLAVQDPKGQIQPDENLPEVVKNIEKQAFEGVGEAQHDLAAIYTAGHGGVNQNYDRAAYWFEQAASRGISNGAYNLGVLHHQGLGVTADLNEAITWYKRAAQLGHPEAQYNLGIAYIEGIGVPYDAQKAAGYFENAARNNIMEAAYNLGLIYENGLLGSAEPDKALVWYKTAADQGSPEAKQALEQLAKSSGVSINDVNTLAENMKSEEAAAAASVAPAAGSSVIGTTSVAAPASNTQAVIAQVQEYLMRMGLPRTCRWHHRSVDSRCDPFISTSSQPQS